MIRDKIESRAAPSLWSLDFILNLIVAHCVFVAYTAMSPIIPLYAEHRGAADIRLPIGVGDFALVISQEIQLGIIVGSFGLIGLIVRPFTGRWVYTFGAKRIAVIGPIVLGMATLLHIFAVRAWLIIPARVAQGIGLALGPVTTSTIAANLAPDHRRGEALSYMSNVISFSMVYSPPLAFFIYEMFGFSASFIYAGAIAFVGSAVAMRLSASRVSLPERQDAGDDKVPLINRRALFPMIVFLTYTFTTAPVYLFMPGIAEERGFGNPGSLLYGSVAYVYGDAANLRQAVRQVRTRLDDRSRPADGRRGHVPAGDCRCEISVLALRRSRRAGVRHDPAIHAVVDCRAGAAARAQHGAGDSPAGVGHRRLVHRRFYHGRGRCGHRRGGHLRHSRRRRGNGRGRGSWRGN